ncbi:HD-GYP domain-containing protein [Propionivibrio sp.]|uniref:HD-GYP domain-containing protein n=1 Tax=Propionivibrio sp. TaxID=2212460 RepID=UPI003BF012E4
MILSTANPTDAVAPHDTVLVIDDSPEILGIINALLKRDYRVKAANSGEKGLTLALAEPKPDIILLDIMMPEMNGHEVCRRLKADRATRDIPVIFLTAMNNEADEETGFALGAVDYITKPISGPILLARVRTHLGMKLAADFIKDKNIFLVGEVSKRARELEFIQDVTILTLASLAETRDNETGNHLRRTQHYVRVLAEHLQRHPHFSLLLTRTNIELITKSAPLHDIGKVGIPDHILLKPGRLTANEFFVMQTHPALGKAAIEHAERQMGRSVPFLSFAKEIAYSHQEKWDGSGYPEGLAGENIPIAARLMTVADVYDALISHRVYKPCMSHEAASEIIREGRGTHFDPDVVDAFLKIHEQFREIAARFCEVTEAESIA